MPLDVEATRVRGRWFRHAYPGSPALPLREPPPDGRWQRGEVVDACYLADEEATAWAEWYRHLAELGLPPSSQMPRDLWTWDVDCEVADLFDEDRLARVELTAPRPGRRTWPPYQRVGEALFAEGRLGLLAPSAARPGRLVLCLFRPPAGLSCAHPLGPAVRIEAPPPPPTGMTT